MTGSIDYGQFAERLQRAAAQGRSSMWQLLRDFQREWGYDEPGGPLAWPREAEDGFKAANLPEEVGPSRVDESLPIPAALDEWWDLPYNSFTHRPTLYHTNPEWPPTIRPDPTGYGDSPGLAEDNPFVEPGDDLRVCVFKYEYEMCNEWGYPAAAAAQADPIVLVSTNDGWQQQSRSISEFFLQLAVVRLPAHYGWSIYLYHEDLRTDPGIVERLRATYPELGLLPWRELSVDGVTFGAPDAIITYSLSGDADFPLMIEGRTHAAAVRVARTLGIGPSADRIRRPSGNADTSADRESGVGPVALAEGDADGRGRWAVLSVSAVDRAHEVAQGAEAGPRPAGAAVGSDDFDDLPGPTVRASDQDGSTVVVGDATGTVHVRTDGAEPLSRTLHDGPVTVAACLGLRNGRALVLTGDGNGIVRLWGLWNDEPLSVPYVHRAQAAVSALSVAALPTGPGIAMAWADGLVQLRDFASNVSDDLWFGTGITALELRPDHTLSVGTADATTILGLDPDRLWPRRQLTLRLDDIDWANLRHRDGDADEIPELIVRATSLSWHSAENAATMLKTALHIPGSACSAAAAAVPFLAELAADPANLVRTDLFGLLSLIAWAPRRLDDDADDEARSWARLGHAAVEALVPDLLNLLDHEEPEIRRGAAYVLADFPDRAPEVSAALRARYGAEQDVAAAASLVLAIGDLYTDREDAPADWLCSGPGRAESREVRAAAAVALLWCGAEELPEHLLRTVEQELAAGESALDNVVWVLVNDRAGLLTTALESRPDTLVEVARVTLSTAEMAMRVQLVRQAGGVIRTWRAAPARLLPVLANLLTDDDPSVRQAALDEIARGGPVVAELPAVADAVHLLLGHRNGWDAERALETLARIGDPRCLPFLVAEFGQSDPANLGRCLSGMARHAERLIGPLREVFVAAGQRQLADVLAGIRSWGPLAEPLVPDLIALLRQGRAVPAVAQVLGAIGQSGSATRPGSADGSSGASESSAADGYGRLAEALPLLRDQLGRADRPARRHAAWALWQITGDAAEALPVLVASFVPTLAESVAERLFDLGPAARPAVPHLVRLLDTHHSGGAAACVIYRATGDAELLPRVIETVAATPVGMLAVRCLDGPAARAAVPRLERIVNSARVLAEADPQDVLAVDATYRDLAAGALARIGNPADN